MKNNRPGQGLVGVLGLLPAAFGIFWTVKAASMGAPVFFCLFGVAFTALALFQWVRGMKRTSGDSSVSQNLREEQPPAPPDPISRPAGTCPYCGAATRENTAYCETCGKKLPD